MSLCPLYDELLEKVKMRPVQIEILVLCKTLRELYKEHAEFVFILIVHHESFVATSTAKIKTMPYNGKKVDGGKGIVYMIKYLPPLLHQIINAYFEMVTDKQKI
jgi:hypothetical protein